MNNYLSTSGLEGLGNGCSCGCKSADGLSGCGCGGGCSCGCNKGTSISNWGPSDWLVIIGLGFLLWQMFSPAPIVLDTYEEVED